MDKKTAEQLEAIVGGEAWEKDGEWVVSVANEDGSITLYSADAVACFKNDAALDANNPSHCFATSIPSREELWVIVDAKGQVIYKNRELERGWRHQEDAEHEARGLSSRGVGKFSVVQQSEVTA